MRTDKTARSDRAAISFSATLIWIKTDVISTPQPSRSRSRISGRSRKPAAV